MQPRAELQTARLTLRPIAPADEAAVLDGLSDLAVSGWLAVVPHPYTAADFHAFQTGYAVPGQTYALADDLGFAGVLGVEDRTLGYWLAPRAQGKGYATEAARAALAEHFCADPSDIASGYFEGNTRSANVLRKLGFVEVGRDMKFCRALNRDRPHVTLRLTHDAFVAALPVEARSARLTYRSLWPIDLAPLHALVREWQVVRQLASWPWPADPAFTRSRAQPYGGRGFVWGCFLDGALVGSVSVTGEELGYMFAPAHWGKGLAQEACQTALSRAFAEGRDHLVAGVWADNAASLRLLDKLGFRITHSDRDRNIARGEDLPGHWLRLDRADWPGPSA